VTTHKEDIGYYQICTPLLRHPSRPVSRRDQEVDWQQARMILFLAFALLVGALLATNKLDINSTDDAQQLVRVNSIESNDAIEESASVPATNDAPTAPSVLSSIFTREVVYWEPQILAWSELHGVDPDVTAILMQIESCGDPQALSPAGARGLFQVMPFHFEAGEDSFEPQTNAARGLAYYAERLVQTNGDIGRAFAGYNGGHVAAAGNWDSWAAETQSYYIWATGLYEDAKAGFAESTTLQRWLSAGGASLCRQAAERLNL